MLQFGSVFRGRGPMRASDDTSAAGVSRETIAGASLILIGGIAILATWRLPFGTLDEVGPGFLPRVTAVLLAAIGFFLTVGSLRTPAVSLPTLHWSKGAMVVGALVAFAVLARPLGMLPACAVLYWISGMAAPDVRPRELLVAGAIFAIACAALFKFGFGLQLPLLAIPGIGRF